jgi:hypothetical protein
MSSFRKSLVGLAGLLALVAASAALLPLAGRGQENRLTAAPQPPLCGQRKFYLTKTKHDGSQALTACAAGYHMASLWEIHDPSNMRYNTALGLTSPDSGSGPPTTVLSEGWIRTGRFNEGSHAGGASCQEWTADGSGSELGTAVYLTDLWATAPDQKIGPWHANQGTCNFPRHVWCVQD